MQSREKWLATLMSFDCTCWCSNFYNKSWALPMVTFSFCRLIDMPPFHPYTSWLKFFLPPNKKEHVNIDRWKWYFQNTPNENVNLFPTDKSKLKQDRKPPSAFDYVSLGALCRCYPSKWYSDAYFAFFFWLRRHWRWSGYNLEVCLRQYWFFP